MSRNSIQMSQRLDAVTVATIILFSLALFAGGASRLHELRLAFVELAALPLLVVAGSKLVAGDTALSSLALTLLGATIAVPMLQVVPLPPSVWTALPGREQALLALDLAGLEPGFAPLSLAPERTWRAFLAALPPAAMFLGFGLCASALRLRIIYALLCFSVLSILVGTAQLASGGAQLYPWPTTNTGTVVGFFANRNHLATLCLLTLPFAMVLGARVIRSGSTGGRLPLWLSIVFVGMSVLALGVIRSRMGVVLLAPTLAVGVLAAWLASGGGRPKLALLGLVGGVTIAIGAVAIFSLAPLLARFDTTGAREGRFENWPVVAEAASTYLPLGSGLGSFDAVYRSVEPLERLDSTFFNQAHNEYLEIWLEAGWPGAALIAVFFVWFARRTWTAWNARRGRERDLQRAASIGIGVVLLHSAVDYPLRTETIAVIFAMMCALLDMAVRTDDQLAEGQGRPRRGRARSAD